MKTTMRLLSLALLGTCATAYAAEDFDGTKSLVCTAQSGHDCLPDESSCKVLKGELGKEHSVRIDVPNMRVHAPNRRNEPLPIQSFNHNSKAMTLQGAMLDTVWSAAVLRQTGQITIAIADREGAYVIFGQCKIDPAPSSTAK